ncbi:hypothetical protein BDV95DRAFT_601983 [Massariosphaeria phaeospora]|uniref:Uncharacterized protein n=1 Tax=Massariosphaeria phaeospora TaxID=100035 RepID=A0A7C8IHA0_9PLEO|nr:hypothetical protein BDV95DRAFT_601983 [Massariosphaeria phaeospora]
MLARRSITPTDEPYSPASRVMVFKHEDLEADPKSIFSSEPSAEHDEAWRKLLAPMYVSASRLELESSRDRPDERLELVDGGYLASVGV